MPHATLSCRSCTQHGRLETVALTVLVAARQNAVADLWGTCGRVCVSVSRLTRAGCEGAAAPVGGFARGTDCPVYFNISRGRPVHDFRPRVRPKNLRCSMHATEPRAPRADPAALARARRPRPIPSWSGSSLPQIAQRRTGHTREHSTSTLLLHKWICMHRMHPGQVWAEA